PPTAARTRSTAPARAAGVIAGKPAAEAAGPDHDVADIIGCCRGGIAGGVSPASAADGPTERRGQGGATEPRIAARRPRIATAAAGANGDVDAAAWRQGDVL